MKPRRKATAKRPDAQATLTRAQGEFYEARTLLAIAGRVLDRIDDSPQDPGVQASVAPCEVTSVLWTALARLDAAILQLDRGLTGAAAMLRQHSPEKLRSGPPIRRTSRNK